MARSQQFVIFLLGLLHFYLLLPTPNPLIPQPKAKRKATSYTVANTTFHDDYLYLSDKLDPYVIEYITSENEYTDNQISTLGNLPLTILNQLDKDSSLIPVFNDCLDLPGLVNLWNSGDEVYWKDDQDVYYRSRRYTSTCTCLQDLNPEILVDMSQYTKGSEYSMISYFEVIGDLVAFGLDTTGDEKYDLYVLHSPSKTILMGPIPETYYSARWVEYPDGYWIYYNLVDPKWGVPLSIGRAGPFMNSQKQVDPKAIVIYTEGDPALTTEIYVTNDLEYLFIKIAGLMTSEYKLVTVEEKSSKISIKSIVMRRSGVMYDLEHHQGYFYFKTNKRHENFEVIRVPVSSVISTELFDFKNDETTIIPGNQDFIEKIEMFQIGLVYWFRRNGMRKLGFVTLTPPFTSTILNQDSKVYSLTQDMTGDFDIRFYRTFNTTCLTFSNSSLLQPPALYSLDLSTMKTTILFQQTSPKHKPDYLEKTIYGETSDTHSPIPISITYKTTITFPAPLLILSYGAYGTFIDPSYNSEIFSLLDRHFIWVICHPRGDGDMGSKWYSTGKFDLKRHTFEDTNSCILKLIRDKFTNDGMIVLKGRSAGGLVAGNAIVSQESRVNVVIAHVPFIDPIYDSIDDSIPWTAYERFEWGNPSTDPKVLDAMIKYSPYLNIEKSIGTRRKAVYVSSGLNDPRVPYYEPLKFVAKLRLYAGDIHKILMRVDGGGHFSAHGMNATAEWMAFAISAVLDGF